MIPLTNEGLKSYEYAKVCYVCEKYSLKKLSEDINNREVRDHYHYTVKCWGAGHSICNLKFNVPNEIPAVFHGGSNYDYHFIVKQ